MPVYYCCVPGYTSSNRIQQNEAKYPNLKGVKFYSLPPKAQTIRRDQWIRMIKRAKTWEPNKYTRICSLHFEVGPHAPKMFPYNNFKEPCLKLVLTPLNVLLRGFKKYRSLSLCTYYLG